MDDKRDGKKKDKKLRKTRSRSRDKRRTPSRSPSYGRRRRERSRSRDRVRRRSPSPPPVRRRGRGRRSPSPPPPPSMQVPPPPMIGNPAATAAAAYMGTGPPMYDAYGGYSAPPPPAPGGYMGDMGGGYGGYDYGAPGGPPPDGYGGMMNDPGTMMMGQPGPPGEEYGAAAGWNAAPPPAPVLQETEEEKRKREAAIALEVQNQRASLKKQRDDYRRRASALKRELKTLKQQRGNLCSGRDPPSPTTNSFVKENDKLQSQIQSKISTIENVIDMLDGIIGKDKTPTPPPPPISDSPKERKKSSKSPNKERKRSESGSPERLKKEVLQTMKRGKDKKDEKPGVKAELNDTDRKLNPQFNFIYYDPELHWCSACDIFPKTAKDYLNHLHSEQHRSKSTGDVTQNFPWREKQPPEESKTDPDLPSKRTPIRGLQFFVPATAWYCKICDYWMGDLPSASVHLKSRRHSANYGEFIDSHTNFEIDWMSDRQKAYEKMRDCDRQQQQQTSTTTGNGALSAVPPGSGTSRGDVDFLTGSSLQKEPSDGAGGHKKRKKSKEEKKDKKKKKRSKKKKKRAASSSSSSSSTDSDSDSDRKSGKGEEFDPATSIRVAMRNLLKAQEAAKDVQQVEESTAGKWTVVQSASSSKELAAPPPPYMTDGAESREKKRDDLMISQWVTPDPIISDSEKKLLEQLKGKLKKRDDGPSGTGRHQDDRSEDGRGRGGDRRSKSKTPPWRRSSRSPGRRGNSRSPVRRTSRSPMRRGSFVGRDRRSPMDRRRDRDFDRGRFDRRRRSRSRGRRSPSYGRGRFRTRRSYSRSRSRSRSRGRRVIEKPVVNFPPEPKPKPEKKVKEKKDDDKKDKKLVSMAIGQKKLPFIGRMPVFKKQQQEAKKEETVPAEKAAGTIFASVENGTKQQPEEFIDMMPDPYQFVALMGAPPPPPAHPTKPDESMLPPGVDEADADLAPKPISDAPIPRKGPLPKDFQEALDILFDGDKPKPAEMIANETKPQEVIPQVPIVPVVDTDQPQMIVPEAIEIYNQQIAAQYSTAVVSAPAVSYDDESQNQPLDMATSVAEHSSESLPPLPMEGSPSNYNNDDGSGGADSMPPAPPPPEMENEETRRKRAELEELAMLGIDADDMAAQIF